MQLQTPSESRELTAAPVCLDEILLAIENETDPLKLREHILQIERAMMQSADAGIEQFSRDPGLPLVHDFADGVYLRTLTIPKGTVLVGKIHKFEHFNLVMRGDITVVTELGIQRHVAPCFVKSPAGSKRLGYAHEDTDWVCIHPTRSTDVDEIEKQVTADTYEEIGMVGLPIEQHKALGG